MIMIDEASAPLSSTSSKQDAESSEHSTITPNQNPLQIEWILVRKVSSQFEACEREQPTVPIDVQRAQEQHAAYVAALASSVPRLEWLRGEPDLPDCVFVEDTAVIIDADLAVITRPGAPSRRREVEAIAHALAPRMTLERMAAPATLDGGDVLRIGHHLFIGLSQRTNEAGANFLAAIAEKRGLKAHRMRVAKGLHLKSSCSIAEADVLLYDPTVALDLAPFQGLGLRCLAAPERLGANVLPLGERRVLVSAAAPRTADLLAGLGMTVVSLNVEELHRADGALTCPSLRIPPRGGWCC
jgi:dimethylargininase